MRVLAFCDYYHLASSGGAERVAAQIYERAVMDGAEVMVLSAVPRHFGVTSEDTARQEFSGPSVETRFRKGLVLSGMLGAQLLIAPGYGRAARMAIKDFAPDVIHINGLHFHSSVAGIRAARSARIPVVATAHLGDVSAMPGRFTAAAVGFDRHLGGWVARSADEVLAVSASVRDHLLKLGVGESRITLAPNGVDHERFNTNGRGPRTDGLRVALVGRLIANKGVLDALDAVAGARRAGCDVTLDVLGDGPLMGEVRQRTQQPELAGALRIHGMVDDVAAHLRQVDVLIRPSYTEGLPLGVLEAMASGVAVVCSDVPGNVELIGGDNPAGIVVGKADVNALTAAIEQLATDKGTLDRYASAGVERAARYTWERSASIHLDAWHHAAMTSQEEMVSL